jgi:hypothetical protein
MDNTIWNIVLSAGLGMLSWILKEKSDELNRIQILLNRTREEVAKEGLFFLVAIYNFQSGGAMLSQQRLQHVFVEVTSELLLANVRQAD